MAVALWISSVNRTANRFLALLLMAISLALAPQILGFAGAYDRFPFLTFAPFDVSLALGPLIYLYLCRLLQGKLPKSWWLHLVPGSFQWVYYWILFLQPLSFKRSFAAEVHSPWVVPWETAAALLSIAFYLVVSFRLMRRYRLWAPTQVSDSENYRLAWLRNALLGVTAVFLLWLGFEVIDTAVTPLGNFQMFPLYLAAAVLLYWLGTEGYRRSDLQYPIPSGVGDEAIGAPTEQPPEPPPEEEWRRLAAQFAARMDQERWYLDPELTLPKLARHLGTNSWTLSRAINAGRGESFNDFVNGFRVQAVRRVLEEDGGEGSLLELALSCGFNSKTSFNRSFKKILGVTPSALRGNIQRTPPSAAKRSPTAGTKP